MAAHSRDTYFHTHTHTHTHTLSLSLSLSLFLLLILVKYWGLTVSKRTMLSPPKATRGDKKRHKRSKLSAADAHLLYL
jgi:hypothetical protein